MSRALIVAVLPVLLAAAVSEAQRVRRANPFVEFGVYARPPFIKKAPTVEDLYRRYKDKRVQFTRECRAKHRMTQGMAIDNIENQVCGGMRRIRAVGSAGPVPPA